ncbi:hypothetical protein HanPSC8_Chr08g0346491 [Helianthus annuus]|nr:hypothetical protein HanPSC8_Chr17g0780451 [Helianthus annuus]KAJ0903217.1 hypothetical protein HanPSC8_Chr08g0346491 [Helianthus annuus]
MIILDTIRDTNDVVDSLLVYLSIILSAEQTQIVRYMELAQRGAGRCGQGS